MSRTTALLFLISLIFFSAEAQVDSVYVGRPEDRSARPEEKKSNNDYWKEKLTWGGNFQAWIGNPTFILLSPTIGYLPHKTVNVGLGMIYNYTKLTSYYGTFSQSIFGGHSYARYIILDSYFLQAQFDKLKQPDLISVDPDDKRWVDYILAGGGFRQNIGEKAALTTSIMYNLRPDPLSIYPSRIIVQFGVVGTF